MDINRLVDFLKSENLYDDDIFTYYVNNMKFVDDPNILNGCFYGMFIDEKFGELLSFKGIVPKICNLFTLLINIHEYMHAILLFKNLGLPFTESLDDEVLPIAFERLYVEKYALDDEKTVFESYQKNLIANCKGEKHLRGFSLQWKVMDFYNKNGYFPTSVDLLDDFVFIKR